ncbi:MAG TPA: DUF4230 domain-containing protein, partial [Chryseolinea sp.]|nr:DUF4230 domain-containing protein [Chryseolinea sp.]
DLKKRFSIQIDDDKAIIRLPNPQLLSIQAMDNVTFMDEQGVWNWVNMDDRAKAMNAFNADARQYAQQAKFVAQAKDSMEKQLREIMKLHGKEVEIRYVDEVRIEKL